MHPSCCWTFSAITRPSRRTHSAQWTNTIWICGIFFRYLKQNRDPTLADKRLDEIDVRDVDLPFIASITLTDIYGYLTYLSRERLQHQNSENSKQKV